MFAKAVIVSFVVAAASAGGYGVGYGGYGVGYAAPAVAKVGFAGPVGYGGYGHGYAAAGVAKVGIAAPVAAVGYAGYGGYGHGYGAAVPAVAKVGFAAPVAAVGYGGYGHGYGAVPAVAKVGFAAPVAAVGYGGYGYGAPAVAKVGVAGYGYGHGLGVAAASPVVAKVAAVGVAKEPVYAPQPYKFGYQSADAYGTKQHRQEVSDGHNNKHGSYGFTDARGVYREVRYVADAHGFRATIHTNEPGTAPSAPAAAVYHAPQHPVAHVAPVAKVAAPIIAAPAVAKVGIAAAPVAYGHAGYGYGHH